MSYEKSPAYSNDVIGFVSGFFFWAKIGKEGTYESIFNPGRRTCF